MLTCWFKRPRLSTRSADGRERTSHAPTQLRVQFGDAMSSSWTLACHGDDDEDDDVIRWSWKSRITQMPLMM